MSKEAQRREAARKQQRNSKLAKGIIAGLCVIVVPALLYMAAQV